MEQINLENLTGTARAEAEKRFKLRYCLQSGGNWARFEEYPNDYIKSVRLIVKDYFSIYNEGIGKVQGQDLIEMTNKGGTVSVWSGDWDRV